MERINSEYSRGHLASWAQLRESPGDGALGTGEFFVAQQQNLEDPKGDPCKSTPSKEVESDASFSSIESPLSPLEIDRIHVMPITSESVNQSGLHLSIKTPAVNQITSGEQILTSHWTYVPVMDVHADNSTALPACLYFERENAKQAELALNSQLSSMNKKEAELDPSALENLDKSGSSFIPVLTTSPITSPVGCVGRKNKYSIQDKGMHNESKEDINKGNWEDTNAEGGIKGRGQTDTEDAHLDNFNMHSEVFKMHQTNTSTPVQKCLQKTPGGKRSINVIQSTPLRSIKMSHLESTPDGAMISANSSGFFGLSDLEDSAFNLRETPNEARKLLDNPLQTKPGNDKCHPAGNNVEYITCPPSVSSVGSVEGKDAEPHSPVDSPHSSTSGHISDLSDSSFNMSDFIAEKAQNLQGAGHGQNQGQIQVGHNDNVGQSKEMIHGNETCNNKEIKENLNPEESDAVMNEEFEDISPPQSHLSLNSNLSETSSIQKNEESTKPAETYISLIAKALLSKEDRKMMLHEIYDKIMEMHDYYKTTKSEAWRNAVRHNLSVNECFIKIGKADTGRGFFWTIHPACVQQFLEGDFQRREARRKVKDMEDKEAAKAMFASRMGLQFPPYHAFPHHPPPPQQHHMMYHHVYQPRVPNPTGQLQALNHQAEILNGTGVQPIRGRIPLMSISMAVNSVNKDQHRYQPYYHPSSSHRQMAPMRPDRKLCDLEETPPNVTINSLGLFVRNGPPRR